jgi:hypothetical protein
LDLLRGDNGFVQTDDPDVENGLKWLNFSAEHAENRPQKHDVHSRTWDLPQLKFHSPLLCEEWIRGKYFDFFRKGITPASSPQGFLSILRIRLDVENMIRHGSGSQGRYLLF